MINDDARIAERFSGARPGYRLLECEPAALPFYSVTTPVLLLQKKPVPPVDEFIMLAVSHGLVSPEEIGKFLGLEDDLVERSLSRLWQSDIVDMPVAAEGRALRLTAVGERVLNELLEVVPVERDVWFAFDRILWRPRGIQTAELIQPKDVRELGLLQIKPRKNARPEVSDLPARAVDRAIKSAMREVLGDVDVLVVKRVERAEQKFLPCNILIYESIDGTDHVLEIAIDGRLDTEIAAAIHNLGGPQHLGFKFGRSATENDNEVEPVKTIVSAVKKSIVPIEEVIEIRRIAMVRDDESEPPQPTDEITGRPAAIEAMEVRNIDTFEHRPYLLEALASAKKRLLITSPWVTGAVVRKDFMDLLSAAARRGVLIHIGYGFTPDAEKCDPGAIDRLEKLSRIHNNVVLSCLGSTHAKILVWDDNQIVTSFNWLSFRGDPERTYRQEQGVLVKNQPTMVDKLWSEDSEWIERVANKKAKTP